jgi:alpha-glucosidase
VQSTLATQLAEYVVIYSPIQMAADSAREITKRTGRLPVHPRRADRLGAVENAAARSAIMSSSHASSVGAGDWYLGAITDESARSLSQPLDFLAPGKQYEAQIYADGPDADYRTNPGALTIRKRKVTSADSLDLEMAPGGGAAIRFKLLGTRP